MEPDNKNLKFSHSHEAGGVLRHIVHPQSTIRNASSE